ncbi:MFS transporter [Tumebacillus permanentifrigoris]|uniref:Putative MFS family arabinose efflux permease n=1 Tax=Tumebacillus permanentifrigoris TaxID=378543 RepID=A0A316D7Z0_9BACL|nr:MFS transporter [Tumebacillus permanentifrigoris]PWK11257.1 putative MFS family arabinose efflux permease [Tumebacillus permanentifrigoris]
MLSYLQSLVRLPRAVHFYLLSEMLFGLGIGMATIFNFHYLALGFDTRVIGYAAACNSITVAICSFPAGIFSDRFGAKKAMALGCGIATLGYVAIPLATQAWHLYLAQVLLAVGTAFIISCEFPYIMSLCERKEDETVAFNMLIAAFTLALSVGNILGTHLPAYLPEGSTVYQTTLFLIAAVFGLMFFMRLFLPASSQRVAREEEKRAKKATWRVIPSRQVVLYVLYATMGGFIFNMIIPFENVILRERFSLSDDTIGYILAANSFLCFLTSLITPYLMQTAKRKVYLYLAFGGFMLGMLLLGFTIPALAFGSILLGRGVSSLMINSFVDSSMMKATQTDERGLHSGLRNLTRSFAGSAATAYAGFVLAGGDYHTTYFIAFLLVVVQTLLYAFAVRRQLQQDLQEEF